MTFIDLVNENLKSQNWSMFEKKLLIDKIQKSELDKYISEIERYKFYEINRILKSTVEKIISVPFYFYLLINELKTQVEESVEYNNLFNHCIDNVGKEDAYYCFLSITYDYDANNEEERNKVIEYRKTKHFEGLLHLLLSICSIETMGTPTDNYLKDIFFIDRLDDLIGTIKNLKKPLRSWKELKGRELIMFAFATKKFDELKLKKIKKEEFAEELKKVYGLTQQIGTIIRYANSTDGSDRGSKNNLFLKKKDAQRTLDLLEECGEFNYSKAFSKSKKRHNI